MKKLKYLSYSNLVICADSGIQHAFNMDVIPDLLVGDMDSISAKCLEKAKS